MQMQKIKIGILFGGRSEEHAVSIKSAAEIARNLNPDKYEPLYVGIARNGVWKICERPSADWEADGGAPVFLPPDPETHGLIFLREGVATRVRLDVIFPVLHGRFGEDGCLQGLLELADLPYVGCDVQGSALCMDKSLAYAIVRDAGLRVPNFHILNGARDAVDPELSYPVFVKPARSGSSFGVSKVVRREALLPAIEEARRFDRKVLVEETVCGREIGCALLDDEADLLVGEPDEIELKGGFFRIHQEKNPESGSENAVFRVPAPLDPATRQRVVDTAKRIYRVLGLRGLARVDLFLQPDGAVVLNEVNTMPGFTSYSRYPRMMAAAGHPLSEIIDRAVAFALADDRARQGGNEHA